jgi:hypothetical protein
MIMNRKSHGVLRNGTVRHLALTAGIATVGMVAGSSLASPVVTYDYSTSTNHGFWAIGTTPAAGYTNLLSSAAIDPSSSAPQVVSASPYSSSTNWSTVTDGLFNLQDGGAKDDLPYAVWPSNNQFVIFNLNLSSAPSGYNVSSLDTYAGGYWQDMQQNYKVEYSTVAAPSTWTILASPDTATDPNAPTFGNYGDTHINLVDSASSTLASGVGAIKFIFSTTNTPSAGYNEFILQGNVTGAPEPTTLGLLMLAGIPTLLRRRRAERI